MNSDELPIQAIIESTLRRSDRGSIAQIWFRLSALVIGETSDYRLV